MDAATNADILLELLSISQQCVEESSQFIQISHHNHLSDWSCDYMSAET